MGTMVDIDQFIGTDWEVDTDHNAAPILVDILMPFC